MAKLKWPTETQSFSSYIRGESMVYHSFQLLSIFMIASFFINTEVILGLNPYMNAVSKWEFLYEVGISLKAVIKSSTYWSQANLAITTEL